MAESSATVTVTISQHRDLQRVEERKWRRAAGSIWTLDALFVGYIIAGRSDRAFCKLDCAVILLGVSSRRYSRSGSWNRLEMSCRPGDMRAAARARSSSGTVLNILRRDQGSVQRQPPALSLTLSASVEGRTNAILICDTVFTKLQPPCRAVRPPQTWGWMPTGA